MAEDPPGVVLLGHLARLPDPAAEAAARTVAAAAGLALPPPLAPVDGAPVVRDATPADLPAMAVVHSDSWRVAYAGLLPERLIASRDAVLRWRMWSGALSRRASDRGTLVAGRPGAVEGLASYGPAADGSGAGQVHAIYCHPAAWRRGRGAALLAAAEERLRAAGYRAAVLWVLRDNERARRFYETAGWHADGAEQVEEFDTPGGPVAVEEVRYRASLS